MAPIVYLLRSALGDTPYVDALAAAGFRPVVVPVLAFDFVQGDELACRLEKAEAFGGLVLTSRRAVDALAPHTTSLPPWRGKRAYCVGPATAERAVALGLTPTGTDAGNADALADLIVADAPKRPLLFCCGQRRMDTLPKRLAEAGVTVVEQVVYDTHLTDVTPPVGAPAPDVLVFFSPSGIEAVAASTAWLTGGPRRVAIGPTTAEALAIHGAPADSVADEPTPEGVRAACQSLFPDVY